MMLSVTWESGSKNEMLWADTRPNGSSARAVSLGEGWCFYVLQKSQHKSGLQHAMCCTNVWQKSFLTLWCKTPAAEMYACTKSMGLCILGGTNMDSGGIWILLLGQKHCPH